MVRGVVAVISVHVVPSPPHSPHASSRNPLFGIPSHPTQVVLVPLQTPVEGDAITMYIVRKATNHKVVIIRFERIEATNLKVAGNSFKHFPLVIL